MSASCLALRAIGGGALQGTKLLRMVYLDESGTSKNESVVAVGGVVVPFDQQIAGIDDWWTDMVNKNVPLNHRSNFAFHATELYWGGKEQSAFPRSSTTREQRWPILHEIAAAPRKLNLAVVAGWFKRREPPPELNHDQNEKILHMLAYLFALIAADRYMIALAPDDEFAMVVAERRPAVEKALKAAHAMAQSPELVAQFLPPFMHNLLPITRIKDTVHFTAKAASRPLQLADVCAFTLRRHLQESPRNEELMLAMFGDHSYPAALANLRKQAHYAFFDWRGITDPIGWMRVDVEQPC